MNTRMKPRAVSSHDMHVFDSLHLHEQGVHRSKVVHKEKLLLPHCLTHAMHLSLPLAPAKQYARMAKFMLLHSHSILLTHAVFGSHCLLTQFLPNWFALPTRAVFAKCNKNWFTLLTHAVFANCQRNWFTLHTHAVFAKCQSMRPHARTLQLPVGVDAGERTSTRRQAKGKKGNNKEQP